MFIDWLSIMSKYEIFLDMDEVITDFSGQFKKSFNIDYKELLEQDKSEDNFKAYINNAGIEFWSKMPWIPSGIMLRNYLVGTDFIFLSSPKDFTFSVQGKRTWINNYYGILQEAHFRDDKELFASEYSILIDDSIENCTRWEAKKGISILHDRNDPYKTIQALSKYVRLK